MVYLGLTPASCAGVAMDTLLQRLLDYNNNHN